MAKECLTCGGVFEPVQRDGTSYFHQCPPLRRARVRRGGNEVLDVDLGDVQAGDERLEELTTARPNARDENVDLHLTDKAGRLVAKAEGRGTRDVPSRLPRG